MLHIVVGRGSFGIGLGEERRQRLNVVVEL